MTLSWYRYKRIEISKPGEPRIVLGAIRHKFNACQYDANVMMADDLVAKGLTIDDIPAGLVRPGISLDALRPPAAEEVPVPAVKGDKELTEIESFTSGKRGPQSGR